MGLGTQIVNKVIKQECTHWDDGLCGPCRNEVHGRRYSALKNTAITAGVLTSLALIIAGLALAAIFIPPVGAAIAGTFLAAFVFKILIGAGITAAITAIFTSIFAVDARDYKETHSRHLVN